MTIASTERLIIRNWVEADRDLFFRINSDPQVMAFFPFRRNRAESDTLFDRLISAIANSGLGFFALALRGSNEAIGFCGLNRASLEPCLPEGTVEIGWRLAPEHWGHGYVTEAALALLAYGFKDLALPEIVSFAVAANRRSTAVMKRIGMKRDPARDFDHPRVGEDRPDLRRHVFYAMSRADWQERQAR
ncbi:GNAT family N-acetyltransferase [Sinorhizobium sp. BG8]|uniref:GNAT family N-acetyltransferase n=1 Tax=Sinorhizobium sp. BG8 TaxID=2613773 RepID=UPI00193CE454|nr:GNAT family N-acetyltransferase [Sinorhizobium sp. BG8]QRM55905.1 GNAT family N-acetyltransferase [Sinorhizobium sp. BG8]